MSAAALVTSIVLFQPGIWAGTAVLIIALSLLAPAASFGVCAVGISLPLSAMLAAAVFEKFCGSPGQLKSLRLFAALGAFVFMLEGSQFGSLVKALPGLTESHGAVQDTAFFLALVSSVIYCAFLSAAVLMLFSLSFEIAVRWFSGAVSFVPDLPWPALRCMAAVICAGLSINLLASLFLSELDPFLLGGGL